MDRVKPITPEDVPACKARDIPDAVFETFNALIVESFRHDTAKVSQDDAVELLVERGLNRNEIFQRGWLDIESAYEAAGWRVSYDKPGYNETYPATYTFEVR